MKDKSIEEMFAHYQPDLGDRNEYMAQLSEKLEALDYVQQYRRAYARSTRRMMVAMFVSGVVTGALSVIIVLFFPQWVAPILRTLTPVSLNLPPIFPKVIFLLLMCLASLFVTVLVGWMASGYRHSTPQTLSRPR